MIWFLQRRLAPGLMLLLAVTMLAPQPVVAQSTGAAGSVFGVATATTDREGEMTPTGNGRFTIEGRVYVGNSIGRSVGGAAAACFTGELRSVEEWELATPKMIGTHESNVTIRSERGALTLRLRGEMEQLTASGSWTIVRSSGDCADLDGDGSYTATYSSSRSGPNLRLTFDGDTKS